MDKISIVIPLYNSEKYIEKCIRSIISQKYKNIEIIIVNDGSTDNSYKIAKKLESADNRIKLINKKNKGVSSARNIGIKKASGDYIIFVDSDDYLNFDAIEQIYNELEKKYFDLIIFEISIIKNNTMKKMKCKLANNDYKVQQLLNKLLKNPKYIERINSVCSKVYKLDIIKKQNIKFNENIQIGEDLLFNIKYLKFVNKIKWNNKAIYNYYVENKKSATKKYIDNKYEQLIEINNKFKIYLKDFKNIKLLKLQQYIKIKNIYSCIINLYHKNCNYTYNEKIKFIKKIKKENKENIIYGMGIKYYILSFVLKFMPVRLILIFAKIINYILEKIK